MLAINLQNADEQAQSREDRGKMLRAYGGLEVNILIWFHFWYFSENEKLRRKGIQMFASDIYGYHSEIRLFIFACIKSFFFFVATFRIHLRCKQICLRVTKL